MCPDLVMIVNQEMIHGNASDECNMAMDRVLPRQVSSLLSRKSSFSKIVAEQIDRTARSPRDEALISFLSLQEKKVVQRIERAWLQRSRAGPRPPERGAAQGEKVWHWSVASASARRPSLPINAARQQAASEKLIVGASLSSSSALMPVRVILKEGAPSKTPQVSYTYVTENTIFGEAVLAVLGDAVLTKAVVKVLVAEGVRDQRIWDDMDATVRTLLLKEVREQAGVSFAQLARVERALSCGAQSSVHSSSRALNCLQCCLSSPRVPSRAGSLAV